MDLRRRGEMPLVIGHRGAAAVAAENTVASLAAAVAAGADLVEFDIGPDLTLGHSADEAPDIAVSLDEALAFLRDQPIGIHLDLKAVGIEEGIVAAVRRFELQDRVVVSTNWARSARALRPWRPAGRALSPILGIVTA